MSSKVFISRIKAKMNMNQLDKVEKLVKKAGISDIDFNKKFTAVKIHFGEPGNLAYIRPNFAGRIVEILKNFGAYVFLTDANTLYKGGRDNAVNHFSSAMKNGFAPVTVGCPVIIADGLRGVDYREIPLGFGHLENAKIASAVADSDILITLNHFKGHELLCVGGAVKNLGMGCGSVGGKMEMHSSSKPKIVRDKCTGCEICMKNCNYGAISMVEGKAEINYDICTGCGQCIAMCHFGAAQPQWDPAGPSVDEKMAEYAYAAVKDKPSFHINFLMNISPECDCWPINDQPLVHDIGFLASEDPVAVDRACVDLVNEAPVNTFSAIGYAGEEELKDKFVTLHPKTDWRRTLDYAEKIGLGSQDYELIEV